MSNDFVGAIRETIEWIQDGFEDDSGDLQDDCEQLYSYIDSYVEEFGSINLEVDAGPITIAKVGIYFDKYCMMYSNYPDKMPDQSLDLRYVTDVLEV